MKEFFPLGLLGVLAACTFSVELEGDDAGECADGADNDGDLKFDCDDSDCAGSSSCDEPADTNDSPDDTGNLQYDTGDTGEDSPTDKPLIITAVNGDCTGGVDYGEWTYWAETNGWTNDGVLWISQDADPAWTEAHNIPSVDYAPDGSWDYLEQSLDIVASLYEQENDVSTLYDCTTGREDTMAWRIDVYDLDDVLADCVVWGNENAIYYNGADSLDSGWDCANANDW